MDPVYTATRFRVLEQERIQTLGIPSALLMESVGALCAEYIDRNFKTPKRWLAVGGSGQNGGDGWVVARHLIARGFPLPDCVLISDREPQGDAREGLRRLEAYATVNRVAPDSEWTPDAGYDLVVDGVFGTGLDRDLDAPLMRKIEAINGLRVPVISLDVPSGVDANSGQVRGAAIDAHTTLTFGAPKLGALLFPGRGHVGALEVLPIGIVFDQTPDVWRLGSEDVVVFRGPCAASLDAHKGDSGRVGVFAGSESMEGAAALTAYGALRAGAGLVTVLARPTIFVGGRSVRSPRRR